MVKKKQMRFQGFEGAYRRLEEFCATLRYGGGSGGVFIPGMPVVV